MLTVAEALDAVLRSVRPAPAEAVALDACHGRVLRQAVLAERDQPPFDRVTMDGIALRHAELAAGLRRFPIQALQAAGDPALRLEPGAAIEIMTGAALPAGADCIVPVERISLGDGVAVLEAGYAAEPRQFIHARASDHAQGAVLLRPGAPIGAMEVAVIASAGLTRVDVAQLPRIAVISTGNELVPAGQPIAAHQVRLSNGPALAAMLRGAGCGTTTQAHVADDRALLEREIGALLDANDVLVLSGGVSMGKADFVPAVLEALGVELVFHKVSQRPGKPLWFGIGARGQAVFGLPGNPVSTLVCCRHYVLPTLLHAAGRTPPSPQFAVLAQPVSFAPALTNFLPVRLVSSAAGQLLALPAPTNTSGDFTALAGTDGYVELAQERSEFPAGTAVPLHRWHNLGAMR